MGRRRRTRPAPAGGPAGPPQVPGHEVLGPVGFGAGGALWSARDRAGRDVVLSVLALPGGEAGTAQLRRLAALRHGAHPHLATVRQVLGLDGGRCAVVSDRVHGPTLATVVAARGRLAQPELATLLSAVGSALGHLHERGVVHGDVSPANVIVTEAGAPVLVDLAGHDVHELGTPGFVPPERRRGSAAGAPGDAWALARLVEWAAGPGPRPELLGLLAPALAAEPESRPAARDLASRAPGIAPALPLRVPSAAVLAQARMRDDVAPTRRRQPTRRQAATAAAPQPSSHRGRQPSRRQSVTVAQPSSHRRRQPTGLAGATAVAAQPSPQTRRNPRRDAARATRPPARHVRRQPLPAQWLGATLCLGVAAVLAGLIVWSGPGERAASFGHRPSAATEAAAAVPTEALGDLLARRDGALIARDALALAATTVPGGPAAREDVVLLQRLQATGTVLEGLRTEVVSVTATGTGTEGTGAEGTGVDVVLAQEAHDRLVDGERVTVPAQPPRCARLVLVAAADGSWQLLASEPCP